MDDILPVKTNKVLTVYAHEIYWCPSGMLKFLIVQAGLETTSITIKLFLVFLFPVHLFCTSTPSEDDICP